LFGEYDKLLANANLFLKIRNPYRLASIAAFVTITAMTFANQRAAGVLFFLVGSAALVSGHLVYSERVAAWPFISGWALFACMLLLAVYNGRKKLPFLPLGSSEAWLQFHIYLGLLTVVLFGVHVAFRPPMGCFDLTLAAFYLGVTLSGLFGWFVSRALPKRMTTRGGEVLFDRIPAMRNSLHQQAEALALRSIPAGKSTTIADFYVKSLDPFFRGPQNRLRHLFEVRSPLQRKLFQISDLNRFLNESERMIMDQIAELVRQKDTLDYHHSLQLSLKVWLFVHIPLTYGLLIFSIVHVVLVYAFSGGAR
jgi:hypothetical protein